LVQGGPDGAAAPSPTPTPPAASGAGIGNVRPAPPRALTVVPVTPPIGVTPPVNPAVPGIGPIPPVNPTPPDIGSPQPGVGSVVPVAPLTPVPPELDPPVTPGTGITPITPIAPDIGGPAVVSDIGTGSSLPRKGRTGPKSIRPGPGITNAPTLPNPGLGTTITNGSVRSIESAPPRDTSVRGIGEESQTDKLPRRITPEE